MKEPNDKKRLKLTTWSATAILVLVAVMLVAGGYIYLTIKNGYAFTDLIDNIVGNLIGVLSAFLLFDILYNKLTQDAYAEETSQQIAKTLMGDPETLDAFSDEDKQAFLVSTVKSMIGDDDAVDMMVGNMKKYFDSAKLARIRKSFHYTITLTTELPENYDVLPGTGEGKYFYVQENLNYEVKYLSGRDTRLGGDKVKIGFSFDKRSLDAGLLESDKDPEFSRCIFNESLDITKEAVEYIRGLSGTELKRLMDDLLTVVLKVDGKQGILDTVDIRDGGIVATYDVKNLVVKDEYTIRIIFHMPKLWNSIFEVTLVDPTKEPKITFDYMPGTMDVTMYSYLNKGNESNDDAYEDQNGLYDIAIKNEWIYPKSGIVFSVRKKETHETPKQLIN